MKILPPEFYAHGDVVSIARDLLGKVLVKSSDEQVYKAIITETEAYNGIEDKASHAYGGRRTKRTEVMYGSPGYAYIYLCYGIHEMLNVVTGSVDVPQAVLIRGIWLINDNQLYDGPGKLTRVLRINRELNTHSFVNPPLQIIDQGVMPSEITQGPRIGIDYAAEDKHLPYRFVASI